MKRTGIVAILLFAAWTACADWAPVYGVDLIPDPPSDLDEISLRAYGEIGSSGWYVDLVSLNISNFDITMDIYFLSSGVGMPVITPWEHTESLGSLEAGPYSLMVKTYQNASLADSYSSSFTVVPEPSTVGLIGVGGVLLYIRRRRAAGRRDRLCPVYKTGDLW